MDLTPTWKEVWLACFSSSLLLPLPSLLANCHYLHLWDWSQNFLFEWDNCKIRPPIFVDLPDTYNHFFSLAHHTFPPRICWHLSEEILGAMWFLSFSSLICSPFGCFYLVHILLVSHYLLIKISCLECTLRANISPMYSTWNTPWFTHDQLSWSYEF